MIIIIIIIIADCYYPAVNPRTTNLDLNGFDSSRFSTLRGGTPRPICNFPEIWTLLILSLRIDRITSDVCVCVREKITPPEEKGSWADKPAMHRNKGWRAVSAEGLQGKASRKRIISSRTHRDYYIRLTRFHPGESPHVARIPWEANAIRWINTHRAQR